MGLVALPLWYHSSVGQAVIMGGTVVVAAFIALSDDGPCAFGGNFTHHRCAIGNGTACVWRSVQGCLRLLPFPCFCTGYDERWGFSMQLQLHRGYGLAARGLCMLPCLVWSLVAGLLPWMLQQKCKRFICILRQGYVFWQELWTGSRSSQRLAAFSEHERARVGIVVASCSRFATALRRR